MQIDAASAITLRAVIEHDLRAFEKIDQQLCSIDLNSATLHELHSAAYCFHNLYNALENIFLQTSRTFENHIAQPERWHRELLEKMFLDLSPVRPALLPDHCRSLLRDLMSFRHVFRHSYDFEIDPEKLRRLQERWNEQKQGVRDSVNAFADALARASRA